MNPDNRTPVNNNPDNRNYSPGNRNNNPDNRNYSPGNRNNSLFSRIDEMLTKQKINNVMETFRKGNADELAKKIGSMDTADIIKKMDEFDVSKLQSMNIDIAEIKQKITDQDLNRFGQIIGENGDEIVARFKAFMGMIGGSDGGGNGSDGGGSD